MAVKGRGNCLFSFLFLRKICGGDFIVRPGGEGEEGRELWPHIYDMYVVGKYALNSPNQNIPSI